MFENYFNEVEQRNQAKALQPMVRPVNPQNSLLMNKSLFLQTINDISSMNEDELYKFIQYNFDSILLNVFSKGYQVNDYVNLFTDIRFLNTFINVIQNLPMVSQDNVIRCNTICYHYLTLPDDRKDGRVVSRMLRISNLINRNNLPRLLGLGLTNNVASMLLLARFSDTSIEICVKRVDFIIITQPVELMTKDMIVGIFRILYPTDDDFARAFPYIMHDVLPEYDENNPNTYWITDEIAEVNSTMNLAILDIMQENMYDSNLKGMLINYAEGHNIVFRGKPVRFSLKRLSDDYYHVVDMVNHLEYIDDVYCP